MADVTRILSQIEQLLPLAHDEIHKLATATLAQEEPGHTLQATALGHDAHLQLVNVDSVARWDSQGPFFSAAAHAMQRILVENPRRNKRANHRGEFESAEMEIATISTRMALEELIALNEALEDVRQHDPVKAELVSLQCFGGMTIEQLSDGLKTPRVSSHRHRTFARERLHQRISGPEAGVRIRVSSRRGARALQRRNAPCVETVR